VSPKSRYDVVLNSYFMSALIGQRRRVGSVRSYRWWRSPKMPGVAHRNSPFCGGGGGVVGVVDRPGVERSRPMTPYGSASVRWRSWARARRRRNRRLQRDKASRRSRSRGPALTHAVRPVLTDSSNLKW